MKLKDFIYIALILIAGVCGAMLNTRNPNVEVEPLKKDIKVKENHLKVLRYKYVLLYKKLVEIKKQQTVDSTEYANQNAASINKIKNLNKKINEISFKGYSNHKLDSLIINLYGTETLQLTN